MDGTLADTDPLIFETFNYLYDKYRDGIRRSKEEPRNPEETRRTQSRKQLILQGVSMLEVNIPDREYVTDDCKFHTQKGMTIKLEHSLISVSKWEEIWEVPFLVDESIEKYKKTEEMIRSYIKCMTITPNVPDYIYENVTRASIEKITNYINSKHTATWFSENNPNDHRNPGGGKEIITAELIYSWMISLNIPVEFEKWHINKLLTLIRVCSIQREKENGGGKKPNASAMAKNNASVMAARRAKMHKPHI